MKKFITLLIVLFTLNVIYSQNLPITGEFDLKSMTDLSTREKHEISGKINIGKILTLKIGEKEVNINLESIIKEENTKITEEKEPLDNGYSYNLLIMANNGKKTMSLVIIEMDGEVGGSFSSSEYVNYKKTGFKFSF